MNNFTLNDKPAVKLEARQKASTKKAILFEIDGKQHWLPRNCIKKIGDTTILIEEWLFKQRF